MGETESDIVYVKEDNYFIHISVALHGLISSLLSIALGPLSAQLERRRLVPRKTRGTALGIRIWYGLL